MMGHAHALPKVSNPCSALEFTSLGSRFYGQVDEILADITGVIRQRSRKGQIGTDLGAIWNTLLPLSNPHFKQYPLWIV
jgi:hypothetical protein